jgi:putative heme-binding domain-containing protein
MPLSAALAAPAPQTAPGYALERIYPVPRDSQGSFIALAPGRRGGLIASDQYGPLHRVTLPAGAAGEATARALPLAIAGVHGLAWLGEDLYAVVGQSSATCPAGLYRLRDRDGDGELDHVERLREFPVGGGEHGPHAVAVEPDGRSLLVLAGNATPLPPLARSRVPRLFGEDALLPPVPAVIGSESRGLLGGGWICRTDRDGREWELVAAGLRNAYALAVDPRGEVFTFDSDTEFEINLPWYRPTRVLHAVSGADFGWRRGAFKVPETAPDGWPTLLPLGLGSPTAVLFPREARIPPAHRAALWVADWSYGRILALTLRPAGATFAATAEEIVRGVPFPVTAICVNPADGALYIATGGRRMHSAIYRLSWTGAAPADDASAPTAEASPAAALRDRLAQYHGRADDSAVAAAWPALAHADPIVRRTARTALEAQPAAAWRDRAVREADVRTALPALLALARLDAREHGPAVLAGLARQLAAPFADDLLDEALRVATLTFTRGGPVDDAARTAWIARLAPHFPSGRRARDVALLELLVWLGAPDAVERGFTALAAAVTREAQLELAQILRARLEVFTAAQRRDYLAWLHRAAAWRGGAAFAALLRELRREAVAASPEAERAALGESLSAAAAALHVSPDAGAGESRPARAWTVADLSRELAAAAGRPDPARGRRVFAAAGCFACHTVAGEGGALGPDLTGIAARLAPRDLLGALLEPNREISDQYGTVVVTLRDGRRLTGRITNLTEQGLQLAENLLDPGQAVRIAERDVAGIEAAKISLMPAGLLDPFDAAQIAELVSFLRGP